MDRGLAALVLTCSLWAFFGFWVWGVKRFMDSTRTQLRDLNHAMLNIRNDMPTMTSLRMELDAASRNAKARSKLIGRSLADCIDALSARMDAVELSCGVREKPKTMGGRGE